MVQRLAQLLVGEKWGLVVVGVHDIALGGSPTDGDQSDALIFEIADLRHKRYRHGPGDIDLLGGYGLKERIDAGVDLDHQSIDLGPPLPVIVEGLVGDEFARLPLRDPVGAESDRSAHGLRLI